MVTFTAILSGNVPDVTLRSPTLREQIVVDLTSIPNTATERVRNDWSFAYAVVNDAVYARIRHFTHIHSHAAQTGSWPEHFHIDTHREFGGAQYDFEEDHVTGRFVSCAPLETVLGYTVDTAVRKTAQ